MAELQRTPQLDILAVSGSYYSCMDCEWEGEVTECDFDTEYDEFKGIDRKYPICPKCGGGLDC
jgi:hypothetical protein